MENKHLIEILIEANQSISNMIDKMQNEASDRQACIDELNTIIRKLDHTVESLEKTA